MYRVAGGFEITLRFNREEDLVAFGDVMMVDRYDATYNFSITDDGEWNADFVFALQDNDEWRLPIHPDKSFTHHYVGTGQWTNAQTALNKKIIWIQS
jgi:hypothetical protein